MYHDQTFCGSDHHLYSKQRPVTCLFVCALHNFCKTKSATLQRQNVSSDKSRKILIQKLSHGLLQTNEDNA